MKGEDPEGHMGVYKRISDVPESRRFKNFVLSYSERDVWDEWMSVEIRPDGSDWAKEYGDRAGRDWKRWISGQRHHALATPDHVERYLQYCLRKRSADTTYRVYWRHVEQFYSWLMTHVDHPHSYHPVWMAANEYPDGAAGEIWNQRFWADEPMRDQK